MKLINLFNSLLIATMCLCLPACGDKGTKLPWEPGGPGDDEPENPEVEVKQAKSRYVWIDAAGNFEQFGNSEDNIKADLKKIADAGFTDIIVDVRPTTGDVLFKSNTADPVKRIDAWVNGRYVWLDRTADFDYLQTFVTEGHKLGLKVNASINTFVGGYLCPYGLGNEGMLFRDSSKKKWATVINDDKDFVNTMDMLDDKSDWGAKFLNPANSEVQTYVLNILGDLAKYDLDGIILDRCRYDDNHLMSDFSDESRSKFESYIGETVANYPTDIMPRGWSNGTNNAKYFKKWVEFRAKTIHDFVVKARNKVKGVNSKIRFGVYVGAWYSTYYQEGVNWASPKYDPSTDGYSRWASARYKEYGYADHLDFIFLGAYASTSSIYGSDEWTMQGFCLQGGAKLKGDVQFIGGPDVGNSAGWEKGGQANKIPEAIDACINSCDGGMFIFDLCHIRMYNYWNACKKGFDTYLKKLNNPNEYHS